MHTTDSNIPKLGRKSFSVVIITQNVEDTIGKCLDALNKVAGEIIVIDAFSTDDTKKICLQKGVVFKEQEWQGFSQTKNLANEMASNDWILSIDSDEILSDELIASLQQLKVEKGKVYSLDRLTNYCGTWIRHSGWYPEWKVRLFNRKVAKWEGGFVHEKLTFPPDFQIIKLSGKMLHFSYKTKEDHFQRIEKYARLSAQEQFQKGKRATFVKFYFSPIARLFRTYFLKRGFLDGKAGWLISWRSALLVRRRYQILKELCKTDMPNM